MKRRVLAPWRRRLHIDHASLKYTADPRMVAALMRRIVRRHHPHLIATTEAEPGDARAVRLKLPRHGASMAGGRMFVWRKKRLRLTAELRVQRLTHVYEAREGWRDLSVTIGDFEDLANGLMYRVFVVHAAATVQNGDRWNLDNPRGVRVHEEGWPEVAALAAAAVAEGYEPVVLGDSNLDQKRSHWRRYLTRELRMPSVFEGRIPRRGSHGRRDGRLIDTIHTHLRVARAYVSPLRRRAPFDHGVVGAVLNLTAALNRHRRRP